MTQEEKAKRYDEAIEIAKKINNEQRAQPFNVMTKVFPELKESEDERIRKAIINVFATHKDYEIFFGASVEDILVWLEKQGEQKPAWSEEDEENLNWFEKFFRAESVVAEGKDIPQDRYLWFKNLKDRVLPQPKQEWSKEDEAFYQRLEQIVCKVDIEAFQGDRDLHSWLKSLRPQNRWKPSVFHLECITDAISMCKERGITVIGLKEILDELKKLKG